MFYYQCIKVNNINNKFFLAEFTSKVFIKLMTQMHLKQRRFTYGAYRLFIENKTRIQKYRKARNSRYIYRNKLSKTCFQFDMTYGDFKYFLRRTGSNQVLHDQTFESVSNAEYDRYQRKLTLMVYKFFNKNDGNTTHKGISIISKDHQLANELYKPITRKYQGRKVY